MRGFGKILAVVAVLGAGAVQAQEAGFDPHAPCGQTLRAADDTNKMLVAAWAFGYVAAVDQDARPVDVPNMGTLLGNLYQACAGDETRSLFVMMQGHNNGNAGPGSKQDAERFLTQFLDPNADFAKLTAGMAPTAAEVAAVYSEPLASKLVQIYAGMYNSGATITPKPGQNSLLITHTNTGSLKSRDAVLRDFPGGYERIVEYIAGDYPIVRFKFVEEGKELGLAFDGLIFINNRWVLMFKPWRALE
ncbi:MAG: hypothetical protein AB8B51_19415 [Sedimentitalea sp.]